MCRFKEEGQYLFVALPEEIDHRTASELGQAIDKRILSGSQKTLVFDFSDTRFMDSSGIGLLAGRYQKMKKLDGDVKIYRATGYLNRILKLSGIEKIIGKYEEK